MSKPATKTSAKTSAKILAKTSGKPGAKPAKRHVAESRDAEDHTAKVHERKRARPAKAPDATAEIAPATQEPAPHAGPLEYHQVAALPTRGHGEALRVCLITTRETRRWTIPKGWPMRGRKDHRAAAIEAEQEAGLKGRIEKEPAGSFLYFKRRLAHFDLVRTTVYRLHVERTLKSWREQGQREVRWVPPHEASMMVEEPGLVALLAELS